MKNRCFVMALLAFAMCACERPQDELEPIGSLYPSPTEATEYELVDVSVVGWNKLIQMVYDIGPEDHPHDVYLYNYSEDHHCGLCGEEDDNHKRHTNVYARVLLNEEVGFSTRPYGSYLWIKAYEGDVALFSECTDDGYQEMWRYQDFREREYAELGSYSMAYKLNLHTSYEEDKGDVDVIFELRMFDKTTGRYYRSNKFHLTTELIVVDGYNEYNANIEKLQ